MGKTILGNVDDVLKMKKKKNERMDNCDCDHTSTESHLNTLLWLLSAHSVCFSIFGGEDLDLE